MASMNYIHKNKRNFTCGEACLHWKICPFGVIEVIFW